MPCHGSSGRWARHPSSRGLRTFYAYAPIKIEYANRPLRDGSEAATRRARPATSRTASTSRRPTTRSPTWRSGPGDGSLGRACSKRGPAPRVSECARIPTLIRWTRPNRHASCVRRGRMVNRALGDPQATVPERHDASDFDIRSKRRSDGKQRTEKEHPHMKNRRASAPAPSSSPRSAWAP